MDALQGCVWADVPARVFHSNEPHRIATLPSSPSFDTIFPNCFRRSCALNSYQTVWVTAKETSIHLNSLKRQGKEFLPYATGLMKSMSTKT